MFINMSFYMSVPNLMLLLSNSLHVLFKIDHTLVF